MRIVIGFACFLLAGTIGCSKPQSVAPGAFWPTEWSGQVGKTVTLEGTAGNAKLGAKLVGEGDSVWIDGLDSWPEGFYSGGNQGKRLRVTGVVITRDDVPVFVQRPGEASPAGVPVGSEADGAGEMAIPVERRQVDRP